MVLRIAIKAYGYLISPMLPRACRFYPSCSEFADAAIRHHGALAGGLLAVRRIIRCGPWHPGGYDPVPGTDH